MQLAVDCDIDDIDEPPINGDGDAVARFRAGDGEHATVQRGRKKATALEQLGYGRAWSRCFHNLHWFISPRSKALIHQRAARSRHRSAESRAPNSRARQAIHRMHSRADKS